MYLADQGADVVKIEPLTGDDSRYTLTAAPIRDGQSRAYLAVNRNKRGIALDLRQEAGQAVIHRLVPRFDVVLVNFRPGVADRLRVDYETLRRINPRLIYVHLTAYGSRGPYADKPGYDLIIQALSGILGRRRMPDGMPIASGVWVADCSAPMVLAYGITLALLMRERSGRGQMVDGSLLMASLAMQSVDAVRVTSAQEDGRDYSRQAMYAPYRCADDQWLVIVIIQDRQWQRLCEALELEHLAADPRFDAPLKRAQESDSIYEILAAAFATRPRAEWLATLLAHDVPAAPVLGRAEIFDHEQFLANDMLVTVDDPWAGSTTMMAAPVRLSDADPPCYRPAPTLGRDTREVLAEAGFSTDEIGELAAQKVIAVG